MTGARADLSELALRARDGDRPALEQPLVAIQEDVHRLALRMTGTPDDALDATQEILIRVMTRRSTFKGEAAFRTWVHRVAINHLLDRKRSAVERSEFTFSSFADDLLDGLAPVAPNAGPELADVVLPAAGNLERDDPRLYMNIKGPDGTLMDTSTRTAATIGERRSDWDFIVELGHALGYEEHFPSVTAFADEALAPMDMTWDELKRHDYVVEPMRYRKYEHDGFGTPTGKFELWSTTLAEWGYDPLPSHIEPPESPLRTPDLYADYPLILNTGVRQPMYWNSNGHPLTTLRRLQPEPSVEIHPDTAATLNLTNGGEAWVETRHGRLRMRVRCNSRTHPQVVSIPHGWWRPEDPAPDHGLFDVCANVLTDDNLDDCDLVLGSSPLKALLCRVHPASPAPSTHPR